MKRRGTFAVSFHIHRGKFKKGKHPIIMRISINGTTASTYIKRYVSSEHWNVEQCRVATVCDDAHEINNELERLRILAHDLYKLIIVERGVVTADMVKHGIHRETGPNNLLAVFRMHNDEFKKRIGKDRTLQSFESHRFIYDSVAEFIKLRYASEDISLKRLDMEFINDYEFYLRVTKRLSPYTVRSRIMLLMKVVRFAVAKRFLDRNPFLGYSPERVKHNRTFLTEQELDKILLLDISEPHLCFSRDLFVFSAFTGLSICDIQTLQPEHICPSSDGELWIIKKRENSDMGSKILLLDIPSRIIRKYERHSKGCNIFDIPSRSTVASHMKIISHMCGFERDILFRMARPSFAGLVTLKFGVPVETVSRMMGYKSAEAAGKFINITRQKIADDMELLGHKMENLYKFQDILPSSADTY